MLRERDGGVRETLLGRFYLSKVEASWGKLKAFSVLLRWCYSFAASLVYNNNILKNLPFIGKVSFSPNYFLKCPQFLDYGIWVDVIIALHIGRENEDAAHHNLTTLSCCDVCGQSGDFMPPVSRWKKVSGPDSNYKWLALGVKTSSLLFLKNSLLTEPLRCLRDLSLFSFPLKVTSSNFILFLVNLKMKVLPGLCGRSRVRLAFKVSSINVS